MRASPVPFALLLLAACATDADLSAAELDQVTPSVAMPDARVLVRGEPSALLPQTDQRPTYEMEVRSPDGSVLHSPGRVLGGALVRSDVVWVTELGALIHADGREIDAHALPELSVSADGTELAYARPQVEGGGVRVVDLATGVRRRVTESLAVADRPLFLPDGRLVVVGAIASGVSGVWIVDPSGTHDPLCVTNGSLRVGRPFGSAFVPPPAYHASMRVEGDALVYDDGRALRRVVLPEAD